MVTKYKGRVFIELWKGFVAVSKLFINSIVDCKDQFIYFLLDFNFLSLFESEFF